MLLSVLDYSPELTALREANKNMTQVSFIDLSYRDILAASADKLTDGEAPRNYNDDYLLARNKYIEKLCEKTGLRNFDEFWEKYFEINGMYEDSDLWFSHLNTYCALARENTPEEVLQSEGCLAREQHMAARIALQVLRGCESSQGQECADNSKEDNNQQKMQRILVITGGFHTPGCASACRMRSGRRRFVMQKILHIMCQDRMKVCI